MKFVLDNVLALADYYYAGLDELNILDIPALLEDQSSDPSFGVANFCRQVAPSRSFSVTDPAYLSALKTGISTLERVLESEIKNNI